MSNNFILWRNQREFVFTWIVFFVLRVTFRICGFTTIMQIEWDWPSRFGVGIAQVLVGVYIGRLIGNSISRRQESRKGSGNNP